MSNKNNKDKVWDQTFGNKNKGYDYTGRLVKKSAYNDRYSNYGWNVDHVRPIADGGTDKLCNKVACHIDTNEEKGDNFPHWTANNKKFKALKTSKNCYKIVRNDK